MQMTFPWTILDDFGILNQPDFLAREWEESLESYRGGKNIFFLQNDFIEKYARQTGLDSDMVEYLKSERDKFINDDVVCAFLWHVHRLFFISKTGLRSLPVKTPFPVCGCSETGSARLVLLALSGCPVGEELNKKRNIPEAIFHEGWKDLRIWADCFRREIQWPCGISPDILNWFLYHCRGEIYNIGRLQFRPGYKFPESLRMYRRRSDGKLLIFIAAGQKFNRLGLYENGADSMGSTFGEKEGRITGNAVNEHGFVEQAQITILLSEWEEYIKPGDLLLDIHIPENGPMTPEDCIEALKRAPVFFEKYLPEQEFKGFVCISWLLDPQFGNILAPTSNIIRFQLLGHLFPVPNESDAFWRIFGIKNQKIGVPENPQTSLQRAAASLLKANGRFYCGGIFIPLQKNI